MSLRTKLLLAQLPLAIALLVVGAVAISSVSELGIQSQRILSDNYRSVLAAQRMKESIERVDSGAMFYLAGRTEQGKRQIDEYRQPFEQELEIQEGNITEPGERAATTRLREAWTVYRKRLDEYLPLTDRQAITVDYFERLAPAFLEVKQAADEVLALNQDAMQHKSDQAQRVVARTNSTLVYVLGAALLAGLTASLWLTKRLLTPLGLLAQAVSRLGEHDFQARAFINTRDEIGGLARQFNTMAQRLQEYSSSSLGELLLAQRASKAAIDSIPDPVIVFTADGGVLEANREADALMPLTPSPAAGNSLAQASPELRAALETARSHVLQGKGNYLPQGLEDAFCVTASAGDRWFLLRATPIYEERGAIAGATVILQDVTRLRRFDELKNDLVATVAHEFRTPLTSLRMAIHLCLEGIAGPLTEKQADLLQAGREDCERLQKTVDELLDLARIQSGRFELKPQPIEAQSLIQTAVEAFHAMADDRHIHLTGEGYADATRVLVDPERIGLVFSNLIDNALRHTPSGGTVRVKAVPLSQFVRFEVSDTGAGVASEYREAIFERFFRIPGAHSGAAGLGLPLAREIVAAHGGKIGVESESGQGSTFWFTVPLADEE